MEMRLKISLLERIYKKSPYIIRKIIVKLRVFFGYKYCITGRLGSTGHWIDSYPRSLEYAKLYQSYYREYCKHRDVQIVENKYVLR